jgi:hypothetical protein
MRWVREEAEYSMVRGQGRRDKGLRTVKEEAENGIRRG